jgi:DnaK suppressor protein
MDELHARELVARERTRVEALLAAQTGEILDDGSLGRQQTGEYQEMGSSLESESVSVALAADLRNELAAVVRAEARIARGTYGRSVQSGLPIPDERLQARPLAERTVAEEKLYEADIVR